jgi:hypothetical protein
MPLYELRIYTMKPGIQAKYMQIVGDVGMPIRKNDYGTLVGAWTADIGTLNQYYHLWSYPDAGERTRLRAGLAKVPGWAEQYLAQSRGMVIAQENLLMNADADIGVRSVEGAGHIYELRTYRSLPGQLNGWQSTFKNALPQREKHSKLVALWNTEVGGLNAAKHLWVYDSLQHRTEVRDAMAKDAELRALRGNGVESLISQESTILLPTSFSPLR